MANIKLRDTAGVEQIYNNVDQLIVPASDGKTVQFDYVCGTLIKNTNGTYDCTNYKNILVSLPTYDYSYIKF